MHRNSAGAHPVADRAALVTGAASGSGRAVSLALAAQGFVVVAVGRDLTRLQEAIADPSVEGRIEPVVCDLADDAGIRGLTGRVDALGGGLDVLVHAAGAIDLGMVESADVARLDEVLRINVRAPFLLSQVLLDHLR